MSMNSTAHDSTLTEHQAPSTLRRYLGALGAELHLRALFPEGAVAITTPPSGPSMLSPEEIANLKKVNLTGSRMLGPARK